MQILKQFHIFHLYLKIILLKEVTWGSSLLGKSEEQYYGIYCGIPP